MQDSRVVQVALLQTHCEADPAVNLERTVEQISQAAADGANIVCLQEVFHLQYPCQAEVHDKFALAEAIPGPTSQRLQKLARQLGVVVIGSIFERRAAGLYHNTAVTFDADGTLVGLYRKMHIPDDPLYYEKFYFAPGDLGFNVAKTRFGTLGVGVCWDQWFPEAARIFALRGAEILFYPTAIGWIHEEREDYGEEQRNAWETSIRAHAIANGLFVAAVNRVGVEEGLQFWGSSFVANPNGSIVAQAGSESDQTLIATCDLSSIDSVRTHWPFLRDRRIDAYGTILERYADA